jgi:hypothetical protein
MEEDSTKELGETVLENFIIGTEGFSMASFSVRL